MVCRLVIALLVSLAGAGGASAFSDVHERALAAEAAKLAAAKGTVSREGVVLRLQLADGRIATRVDDQSRCGQDGQLIDHGHCVRYVLVDRLAAHDAYLVLGIQHEHEFHEWIDARSGQATLLGYEVFFSPSGRRFATQTEECLGCVATLEIWAARKGGPRREWQSRDLDWYYDFQGWQGEDVLVMAVSAPGVYDGTRPARVIKSGRTWKLRDPPGLPP